MCLCADQQNTPGGELVFDLFPVSPWSTSPSESPEGTSLRRSQVWHRRALPAQRETSVRTGTVATEASSVFIFLSNFDQMAARTGGRHWMDG